MGLRDRASLRAGWFCSLVKLLSVFYHMGQNEAEISWGVWEVGGGGPGTSAVLALTFDLAIAKYMLRMSSGINICFNHHQCELLSEFEVPRGLGLAIVNAGSQICSHGLL